MISRSKKNDRFQLKARDKHDGFNLIEVAAAMAIVGTCMAYAMPVILYSKISSFKSEERAGALIVSQKIFDSIRGRTFGNIPTVDTTITNTTTTNTTFPALPIDQFTALGRSYNVSVRYCENDPANSPPNPCTPNYRQFRIIVRNTNGVQTSDNSIIYEMQAAFTSFN
jgi:prepilin-type N-terminal cleavage/methylation domain-containing protein